MEDREIVALLFRRDEAALGQIAQQYGNYLTYIANQILDSPEDGEECVNEVYLAAWNAIPPHQPEKLASFLAKLTRRTAINRYRAEHCQKRTSPGPALVLSELADCVPDRGSLEDQMEGQELAEAINRFLRREKPESRQIFLSRYFYQLSIREIGQRLQISQSKVKSSLLRTRRRLKTYLEQEGMYYETARSMEHLPGIE